jgi:hypothetical protein
MSYNDSDPTDPTRNTLFQIKKISAGVIAENMQRVFWAGRSTASRARRRGLVHTLRWKQVLTSL